jgi:hypothetical protein
MWAPKPLSETDQLLIVDLVNRTGDETFEGLKTALTVKLEESPYLNVVPATAVQEALQQMERPADTPISPDSRYYPVVSGVVRENGDFPMK